MRKKYYIFLLILVLAIFEPAITNGGEDDENGRPFIELTGQKVMN